MGLSLPSGKNRSVAPPGAVSYISVEGKGARPDLVTAPQMRI